MEGRITTLEQISADTRGAFEKFSKSFENSRSKHRKALEQLDTRLSKVEQLSSEEQAGWSGVE